MNKKPEKSIENEILTWCSINRFWVHKIESKAIFSQRINRYLRSNAPVGHSDISGITPCSYPAYIEVKDKGKRNQISEDQMIFLLNAIMRNAFAVCVESTEQLQEFYKNWFFDKNRQIFLINALPKKCTAKEKSTKRSFKKELKEIVSDPYNGLISLLPFIEE